MSGIPISMMPVDTTMLPTDKIPFSRGSALGGNLAIEYQNFLLQFANTNSTSFQNSTFSGTNASYDVITNFNLILGPGSYVIDLSTYLQTSGTGQSEVDFYISYNVNPAITAFDITDVIIPSTARSQTIPVTNHTTNIYTKSVTFNVPALGSYIIKVNFQMPSGTDYRLHERVLSALKIS